MLRPEISNEETASSFVSGLSSRERERLAEALQSAGGANGSQGELTRKLLMLEATYAGLVP